MDRGDNACDDSNLEAKSEVNDGNDSDGAGQGQGQVPTDRPSGQGKFTLNAGVSAFPPPMLPRPTPRCSSAGLGFSSLDSVLAAHRDHQEDEWMPAAKHRCSSSHGASSSSAHGTSSSLTASRRGASTSSVPQRSTCTHPKCN